MGACDRRVHACGKASKSSCHSSWDARLAVDCPKEFGRHQRHTTEHRRGFPSWIPSSFPAGVYGFQIEDPSAQFELGLANAPSLDWAIGVPSVTDVNTALRHEVHDCGAEQGATLRIFGKNFIPSMQVVLQSAAGKVYRLRPSGSDTNSISVPVTSTLAPGTYTLWVGTFPWSVTSTPPSRITVYTPPSLTVKRTTCPNLVGDGATDNTAFLQSCLDRMRRNRPKAAGLYSDTGGRLRAREWRGSPSLRVSSGSVCRLDSLPR